jgi:hypothetical protein
MERGQGGKEDGIICGGGGRRGVTRQRIGWEKLSGRREETAEGDQRENKVVKGGEEGRIEMTGTMERDEVLKGAQE